MAAYWSGKRLRTLRFRNGAVLDSPDRLDLAFLFHETWINRVYTPPDYEIHPDDVIIDVGANIGVFSIYAATRATGVKVYSYEPYPGNILWLKKNIQVSRLSNIQVFDQAVAGSHGCRSLRVFPSNWILHRLEKVGPTEPSLPVQCVTLDEVFISNQIKTCHLLKLDCEGSEYEILQNCSSETLRRVKRIVGEYHESPSSPNTGQALCRLLKTRSFRVERFDPAETGGSGMFFAHNEMSCP